MTRKALFLLALWIAFFFRASGAGAQPPAQLISWGPVNGPYGKSEVLEGTLVQALALDPQAPSTLYAGTAKSGLFKSLDGGAIWTALNLPHANVIAIAVNPQESDKLYVSSGDGVFKSADGGASWERVADRLEGKVALTLKIDPRQPETIYAGLEKEGVYKSTDGGQNWVASGLKDVSVLTIALDPQSQAVYAGTIEALEETNPPRGAIFKSTDGGENWTLIRDGFVRSLAVDPLSPQTIYAGTITEGLLKSTDGGASWELASQEISEIITLEPDSAQTLYAGTGRGVFRSTDGGQKWSAAGLQGKVVFSLALDPPQTIYAGTIGEGVFKSDDGGLNWRPVNRGSGEASDVGDVLTIAVDHHDPDIIYAGTKGAGVFKSVDAGRTWEAASEGLTHRDIRCLAVDPTSPATLYVGTEGGVFKSTNGGEHWEKIGGETVEGSVRALALDFESPQTIYVGLLGEGVFRSDDGGTSWKEVNEGLLDRNLEALAVVPGSGTVYAGTGGGAFKSTDKGSSWLPANKGLTNTSIRTLALAPGRPETLYAGTYGGGIFKSEDGAGSWHLLLLREKFYSLVVDPVNPQIIYAATGEAIWFSQDGGESWGTMDAPGIPVRFLALAKSDPQVLYAAGQRGVVRGLIDRGKLAGAPAGPGPATIALFAAVLLALGGGAVYIFVRRRRKLS
ncbi:MAG: WD40/YVTN/BNR-like repeat-containing protein [Anaerolineae bacterium]